MSQQSANRTHSRSSSSSSSSSFVDETGAGSSSSATVTSPSGNAQSSQTVFTPGATSSKGSATATGGSDIPPVATADATAPAQNATPATSSPSPAQENTFIITLPDASTQDTAQLFQLLADARAGGREWLSVGSIGTVTSGTSGGNVLVGTGRNDQMFGRAGNDRCLAGAGNDWVRGGAGNDQVNGGQGDDVLHGNSGRDILVGGGGQDLLLGGAEADVFVLSNSVGEAAQVDVCMDFDAAQGDRIRLPKGVTYEDLALTNIDTNGDGVVDSTLIQAGFAGQVQTLAVVLNTVTGGVTTLNSLSFSTVA